MAAGAPPLASVDVAVVGAGIVGSALSLALQQKLTCPGAQILVIDSKTSGKWQPIADTASSLRTVAITPASQRFLQTLGVWQRLPKAALTSFDTLFVYGRSDMEQITFSGSDRLGVSAAESAVLGYIVEERALLETLHRCLEEASPSANLQDASNRPSRAPQDTTLLHWSKADFGSLTWTPEHPWIQLTLRETETQRAPVSVAASLIVAADGSRSPVRQEIGLGWIGQSYDQRAVVAVVENHQPNRMAIQRFLPNGPVAVLPMGGNGQYSNIVWSTNESEADWLESKATESQFLDALHTALHSAEPRQVQRMANKPALTTQRLHAMVPTFRRLVPSAEDRRDRKSFPLHFGSATTYDANRTVLVGDAAHVVHPLAGQGVNLGIADAETLAGVLQHAWRTGRDVGDSSLLAAYTRQRLPVNTMMLLTLSTLRRLFALPSVTRGLGADLASSARGLGLRTLEVVSPLRAALVRIATGDYGS